MKRKWHWVWGWSRHDSVRILRLGFFSLVKGPDKPWTVVLNCTLESEEEADYLELVYPEDSPKN